MTKTKKIVAAIGGTTACLAAAYFLVSWISDRPIRAATALQDQLLQSGDLSAAERNELKLRLMRTVDEMDREQAAELYSHLKRHHQQQEAEQIAAYHAASGEEKTVLLDAAIQRWANAREVYSALRSDGVGRRNKNRKQTGKKKTRKELTDAEKEEWAQKKKLNGEYYQALKARATELGLGDDRGKRKRG